MTVPGTRNFAVPSVAKGVVKRSRAAYRGVVPFPGPFTRFVRGPLLARWHKECFFLVGVHCCPASALAEEREGGGGGGDERRRGGPQDPFCRARILGARCSLYAYPPPPTRRSFLPRSRLRNPRIIIAALSETREG